MCTVGNISLAATVAEKMEVKWSYLFNTTGKL